MYIIIGIFFWFLNSAFEMSMDWTISFILFHHLSVCLSGWLVAIQAAFWDYNVHLVHLVPIELGS